jgi:beta-glucosidase
MASGETANITLIIPVKDLAYYDVNSKKWIVEPGKYKLLAGTSSRDIKATGAITVN